VTKKYGFDVAYSIPNTLNCLIKSSKDNHVTPWSRLQDILSWLWSLVHRTDQKTTTD